MEKNALSCRFLVLNIKKHSYRHSIVIHFLNFLNAGLEWLKQIIAIIKKIIAIIARIIAIICCSSETTDFLLTKNCYVV